MRFYKMQGIGNDFIMIDGRKEKCPQEEPEIAIKLCDRHFGIGGDGLIFILPSDRADIRMHIINSDGSVAEMCGNGIRCFAKLVYDLGIVKKTQFAVETLAGIMTPSLHVVNDRVTTVTVDMGEPNLNRRMIPMLGPEGPVTNEPLMIEGQTFHVTSMLMGVPHTVTFVEDVEQLDLCKYGPGLERHPVFPRKTNANFVEVISPVELKYRVWERGAGLTLACGTGACSVLVAAVLNNKTQRKAKVHLPGGTLDIEWAENNHVYMTGAAELVFTGEV